MIARLYTLTVLIFLAFASNANAQEDAAPFGLRWMASSVEIEALGVALTPMDIATFGKSFAATNLPKAISDLEAVVLSFGYDDRLWRVAAIGNEFDNDKYGSQAKSRYDQLAASLAKSYALTSRSHRPSSDNFYGKADNFAYALSKSEAYWYSLYGSPSAEIELSIGSNHQDTYWRLVYSHIEGKSSFTARKADAELDAL
ncbi:hypothetical protein JHL21_13310 [Devosia sp. WQ 349]|uniref:hypothetical protein n=1 Tax=Devosia sp. WQ 349K1 TaxID=2800329 RepID=UPI001907501D|nr:hypothetical protein [Devosia sp. WQ 349K1]MBK1795475.1 hypothetical protein [Devosia sp. WQ 349K1]